MNTSSQQKTLFIGNSLNLLTNDSKNTSWVSLLEELEGKFTSDLDPALEGEKNTLPFLFRTERLFYWKRKAELDKDTDTQQELEKSWETWYENIAKLAPNRIHHLLARNNQLFDQILTTNYDYCIEKALKLDHPTSKINPPSGLESNMRRRHGKVWHIHGEAFDSESIVMRHKTYIDSIPFLEKELKNDKDSRMNGEKTWLDIFLSSDVYICGLSIRFEEYLLWFALQKRLELPDENRKKVVIYLFCRQEQDEKECEDLRSILTSFMITPVIIPVPKNTSRNSYDFEIAWQTLLGHILLDLNEPDEIKTTKIEPTNSFPQFRHSWTKYNIVASASATKNNPNRCWMNITVKKLNEPAFDGKYWIFDCCIEQERKIYVCPVSKLKEAFELKSNNVAVIENNPRRHSFYIDYKNGKLYATISESDTKCILELDSISTKEEFNAKKTSMN